MKILLVNPKPVEAYTVYGPSLGLCYISAYLKQRGISTIEGIDLNIDSNEDFDAALNKADLVGVYCSTKALKPSLEIAEIAKKRGKVVVLGGPHPSVMPEEVLESPYVDYVILSEGEESFFELINAINGSGFIATIDGIGYKDNGLIKINPRTSYVKNLDSIPFPDRDLFKFDYSKTVTFCATRGCPYKCANCQPALSLQTCAFRMRSVDNVIAELKEVGQGKIVHFIDNDLTVNRKWIKHFCERIVSEGIKMEWGCQGRVNTLDRDLLSLMRHAGCSSVSVGIESGSQRLLDGFLKKQMNLKKAESVISDAVAAKMPLHGWFIIGIPSETREDIESTIQFALSHDFASVGFSIGTPWPGTMFYKLCKENSWLLSDDWDKYNEKRYSMLKTPHWGPDDISDYKNIIVNSFRKKDWAINENDFMFGNPYW